MKRRRQPFEGIRQRPSGPKWAGSCSLSSPSLSRRGASRLFKSRHLVCPRRRHQIASAGWLILQVQKRKWSGTASAQRRTVGVGGSVLPSTAVGIPWHSRRGALAGLAFILSGTGQARPGVTTGQAQIEAHDGSCSRVGAFCLPFCANNQKQGKGAAGHLPKWRFSSIPPTFVCQHCRNAHELSPGSG